MGKRILIIQGHPDRSASRFGHALAASYAAGAISAGHEVELIDVAALDFPLLRSKDDFENGAIPEALAPAQSAIAKADHLVILYPLWLGSMPALLKGFLEQVMRPGFAVGRAEENFRTGGLLKGKSARVIVTMGMPAFVYRWFFRAHSLRSLERNILAFAGIAPVRSTLIGTIEGGRKGKHLRWLGRMEALGRKAA